MRNDFCLPGRSRIIVKVRNFLKSADIGIVTYRKKGLIHTATKIMAVDVSDQGTLLWEKFLEPNKKAFGME